MKKLILIKCLVFLPGLLQRMSSLSVIIDGPGHGHQDIYWVSAKVIEEL